MKVIFLDIDGVMIRYWEKKNYREFDPDLVINLKHLLANTNANIVISSSWRHWMESVQEAFRIADLPWDRVISKTWSNTDGWRSTEILQWLDEYHKTCKSGYHITHWCAIDDEWYEMKAIKRLGKLVKTEANEGLTLDKAEEAISLLT